MLTVSSDEIRCRVEKLRRQFQTSDPFILCRQLDVQLKGVNFGETEHSIKAMTTIIFRIRMIQYNSNLPRTLLTFILAHELGHILLHSREIKTFQETETTLYETNRLETEANRFAAELLPGNAGFRLYAVPDRCGASCPLRFPGLQTANDGRRGLSRSGTARRAGQPLSGR